MQYCPFDVSGRDAKEKPVVVDELRLSNDNPFKQLTEKVLSAVFERSGYRTMTSGYIEDVEQVSQERLHKFWQTFYGPNNATMVICGPANVQKILRSVHKHFGQIKPREIERMNRDERPQNGPKQVFVYSEKPYTMAQLAFRSLEGMNKDSVTLDLIAEVMQYPKIGILSVLKEMNAVPQYAVVNNRTKRRNVFQITGSLATPQGVETLQGSLFKWFAAIAQKDIDPHIFNMAKKKLMNKWQNAISFGGVEALSAAATEAVSMGNIGDLWDRIEHLKVVTPADVKRVAKFTFQPSRCTLGVLCPQPQGNVLRPSVKSPDYYKHLFDVKLILENADSGIKHLVEQSFDNSAYKVDRYDCNFGLLQHLQVPTTKKNMFVISTKPASTNEMLSKIATKIIVDGVKSATLDHKEAHTFVFGKPSTAASFSEYMIEKNMNFNLIANKGRLTFEIAFDHGHDLQECLGSIAEAIKNIPALSRQNVALKASIVAGELAGSLHDMNFVAHKMITDAMFEASDINRVNDPNTLIKSIDSITLEQLKAFIDQVFDSSNAFSATVVSAESAEIVGKALQSFYQHFSNNAKPVVPTINHVSDKKNFKSETFKVVEPGKNDGVIGMGVRLNVSRRHEDFTAMRVAVDVLGDGIYSRLNKVLRIEKGLTYGTYARLRGGLYNSDSYMHIFGSFSSHKLNDARGFIDDIVREFASEGITEKEFNDKRCHLKNSLKVRMDNSQNLLNLHHQTWLSDSSMTVDTILSRIDNLTHDKVNKCIKQYLSGAPVITVLAGLPKE